MWKPLSGSKTQQNLKGAFAGEPQANRRYLYFAQSADVRHRRADHYVKVDLGEAAERALRDVLEQRTQPGDAVVELASTHPRYPAVTRLSAALVASLAGDLA